MYSRPVARLLWCARSERKGCGSTLGQQELAVKRLCGNGHFQWHVLIFDVSRISCQRGRHRDVDGKHDLGYHLQA